MAITKLNECNESPKCRAISLRKSSLALSAIIVGTSFHRINAFCQEAFAPRTCDFETSHRLTGCPSPRIQHQKQLSMSASNDESSASGSPNEDGGDNNGSDNDDFMDDLSWRVAKVRLEEANKKRFLKRKPVKLPYEMSRRWIQMNWAPKTKEEFFDLVDNGNLRTPYISKQPEEYYSARGEWISWDHYLLGTFDNSNSTDGNEVYLKWQ